METSDSLHLAGDGSNNGPPSRHTITSDNQIEIPDQQNNNGEQRPQFVTCEQFNQMQPSCKASPTCYQFKRRSTLKEHEFVTKRE